MGVCMSTEDLGFDSLDDKQFTAEVNRLNKEVGGMDNYVRLPEKDGFVALRFLPKLKNKPFYLACRVHRLGVYPNSKTVFCTRKLISTPRGDRWLATSPDNDCPICIKYTALWEQTKKMTNKNEIEKVQSLARSIKPAERYYYNVIVRSQVNTKTKTLETNVGPKVYSCPKQVHEIVVQSITGSEISGRRKLGDIAHPVTGRDFRLVKQIKGGAYPDYGQSAFEDISILGTDEQIRSWVKSYHDLEAIPIMLPIEEIRKILSTFIDGDVQQPKVASAPASSSKATAEKVESKIAEDLEGVLDSDWDTALKNIGVQ